MTIARPSKLSEQNTQASPFDHAKLYTLSSCSSYERTQRSIFSWSSPLRTQQTNRDPHESLASHMKVEYRNHLFTYLAWSSSSISNGAEETDDNRHKFTSPSAPPLSKSWSCDGLYRTAHALCNHRIHCNRDVWKELCDKSLTSACASPPLQEAIPSPACPKFLPCDRRHSWPGEMACWGCNQRLERKIHLLA